MGKVMIVVLVIIGCLIAIYLMPTIMQFGVAPTANTTNITEYWGMAEFNLAGPLIIILGILGFGGVWFWKTFKRNY